MHSSNSQEQRLEQERIRKWTKMVDKWDKKKVIDSDKLKRRVYKGIPDCFRGKVWSKLLGLDTIKEEQRGKYEVNPFFIYFFVYE